ncbi:hypothetical protein BD769DRAFT_1439536 [Suillus cothurnatus]|nr:hypothetical protein BD769DRAFT_1439536 [Suillus cothurnatus]
MRTPLLVVGSTVRDFCMLERNFLSHIKLILLLLLIESESLGSFSLPLAILQFIAALLTIAAAFWEYHTGLDDLMKLRAFFVVHKIHHIIMAAVTFIIVTTCIIYVAKSS